MAVLHPDIRRRTGLPGLCVLHDVTVLSGRAFSMYI